MARVKQSPLLDLAQAGEDGIEWREEEVALYLLPESVGPAPSAKIVNSIRQVGVVSPIVVMEQDGSSWEIVDGNRRVAAARLLGNKSIPARIGKVPDLFGSAMTLVLNEQRSANPYQEYVAIKNLQEKGKQIPEIQKLTGLSIATIRRRMAVASLLPDLLEMFRKGDLKSGPANLLCWMPVKQQKEVLDRFQEFGEKITIQMINSIRAGSRGQEVGSIRMKMARGSDSEAPGDTESLKPTDRIREILNEQRDGLLSPSEADHRIRMAVAELESLLESIQEIPEMPDPLPIPEIPEILKPKRIRKKKVEVDHPSIEAIEDPETGFISERYVGDPEPAPEVIEIIDPVTGEISYEVDPA